MTKEFESSVPIRCTLLVDTSVSVRVPSRQGKPLHRLIGEIAAAILLQCNASVRDLTGLCLFDEQSYNSVRPDRRSTSLRDPSAAPADRRGLPGSRQPASIEARTPAAARLRLRRGGLSRAGPTPM